MIATKSVDLRTSLKKYMDAASEGETVIVARPSNRNVVIVSEKEYNELLKARRNADYLQKLDHSFAQIADGKVVHKTLEELEQYEL